MVKKLIFILALVVAITWAVPEPAVEGQIGYQVTATSVAQTAYPLLAPDGTAGAPSFSFTNDTDTGIYQNSVGNIGFAAGGSLVFDIRVTNTAGAGAELIASSYTLNAMDGSDTVIGFQVDLENADHTGSSNFLYGIDVDDITGDAQATEIGLALGSGYDIQLQFADGSAVATFSTRLTFLEDLGRPVLLDLFRFPRNTSMFADLHMVGIGDGASTIAVMDGSDTYAMLKIDFTNADHTGSSNLLYGLDIDDITGDAQATEYAIHIEDGWDYDIIDDVHLKLGADSAGGSVSFSRAAAAQTFYSIQFSSAVTTHTFSGNSNATSSAEFIEVNPGTITIQNGSDTYSLFSIDSIPAGDHTGSGNNFSGYELGAVTADAHSDMNIFFLGDGWDYLINDQTNTALGTLTWTTNADKSGNTGSGTIRVYINGTLYHIQLYADS